jgi:hypothetical protein
MLSTRFHKIGDEDFGVRNLACALVLKAAASCRTPGQPERMAQILPNGFAPIDQGKDQAESQHEEPPPEIRVQI